ncbi:MAG: GNAT family N-acetyltransferase [Lachnospiraceae bacterium]|nr:GNAT family N-acetyltransferase [Lachnospiraceae bacterium]
MDLQLASEIRYMEEISLNAWPSHKSELYDGWLIRYSHNYTYRTNSVEQVGASSIPIPQKVEFCENAYRHHKTPANFKINPLIDPSFDRMLAERGYEIRHITEVMTADLDKVHLLEGAVEEFEFGNRLGLPSSVRYSDDLVVLVQPRITDEWIAGVLHLNGTCDPALRRIVPAMYKAIPKKTIVCSIEVDGRMVASGLGICDREFIGIYAIYVSPACRRRKYARAICSALLLEGSHQGASRAYLQVVKGNANARRLYMDLGFEDFYTYWFRSKEV